MSNWFKRLIHKKPKALYVPRKCPDYIAHPQSVWFERHWMPIFDELENENEKLRKERADLVLRSQKLLRKAQETLNGKDAEIKYLKDMVFQLAPNNSVYQDALTGLTKLKAEK